jgi:hypothetical protein
MESEELGGSFVIAVEEHGPPGLWNQIKEVSTEAAGCCGSSSH